MRVLTLIVAIALALRVWGLTFGLPYAYHVDESVFNEVAHDAAAAHFRTLQPNFSGFQLIVIGENAALTAIEPLVRALHPPAAIAATLDSPYERYDLVARVNSAVLGALTCIPVFLIGARLWDRRVGLFAALCVATCYMLVRDSHFGVPDVTVTFLTITAAWAALRLSDHPSIGAYVAAGALAGVATGTKQLVWPIFLLLIAAHWDARKRLFDRRLWIALTAGVAAYLVCVPQTVLHWSEFWAYWRAAATTGARGGMDRQRIEDTGPLGTYLYSLRWGLGDALAALAAAGLAAALVRGSRAIRIVALFAVVYFAFLLLPGHTFFARYALPVLPFLLLMGAALAATLVSMVPEGSWRRAAWTAVVAGVLAQPFVASIRFDRLMTRPDTRTLAKAWIEEHIPENATIMLEFYWFSPQLSSAEQPTPMSARTYQVMSRGAYGLSDVSIGFGPSQGTLSVSDYMSMGVEYIVSNSYSRGSSLLDPAEDRAKRGFYDELDAQATLLKEFSPYVPGAQVPRIFAEAYGPAIMLSRYERPGPVLRIYQLPRPPFMR